MGEGWIFLQYFGGLVFRDVFADNGSRSDGFEFDFSFHFVGTMNFATSLPSVRV